MIPVSEVKASISDLPSSDLAGSDVISALVCVPADPETAGQFSSKLLAYCQQHGKLQKRSLQNYWLIAYPVTWQLQKKKAVEEEEEETGDKKKEEEERKRQRRRMKKKKEEEEKDKQKKQTITRQSSDVHCLG